MIAQYAFYLFLAAVVIFGIVYSFRAEKDFMSIDNKSSTDEN